jgi:glycosyltransferase involved in cell wall biosynthesis
LAALESEWNKERIKKRIRLLQYAPLGDISTLYKGALFLAFPSLYEGFGLPPLEAMSLGVPVLTSNVSSLPEICADAALYVNPYDVKDMADKMTMMINDKELRDRLIVAGSERVKFFSMDNYKERLREAYYKI